MRRARLGEEVGGGGGWLRRRWSRMGRPEGYRIDAKRKEEDKTLSKIAWELSGTGKEASWGPSWKCRQIWRAQATGLACSSWLALHVSLVAGKAAPASGPAPVSPFLCSPICTTGNPRATPYSFLPNYGSGRASTSPAVSDSSSQPLISTFLTILNPISLRLIFSA